MTQTLARILDCGHEPTPDTCGTGYSTERTTGETKCYPCSDDAQRYDIALFCDTPWVGYIHKDKLNRYTVTTWTGGFLARVTFHTSSRTGFRDSWVHRWWARTPDGREWYGSNGGDGESVIMRPVNRKAKPQPYVFIPPTFPVQPLKPGDPAGNRVTCMDCGLSWDDSIPTEYTPTPVARCPFEAFH